MRTMSQPHHTRRHHLEAEGDIAAGRHVDWAVLVIVFALACTLAWTGFWLWALVRGLHVVFS
jgi:hypothetical protein